MQWFRLYTLRVYSDPPRLSTLSLFLFGLLTLIRWTRTALPPKLESRPWHPYHCSESRLYGLCLLAYANTSIASVRSGGVRTHPLWVLPIPSIQSILAFVGHDYYLIIIT